MGKILHADRILSSERLWANMVQESQLPAWYKVFHGDIGQHLHNQNQWPISFQERAPGIQLEVEMEGWQCG